MAKPTPTQEENDRAALGEHVIDKEYDRSGLDTDVRPPGSPPPVLPPPDQVEPPEPQPEPPGPEPKQLPA